MSMQSTLARLRPGLRERAGIAGAVTGIAAVLVVALLLLADARLESANRASLKYAQVLELAGDANRETVEAETSTRAYLLTGRKQYAADARRSFARAHARLDRLSTLVAGDSDEAQEVAAVRSATARLGSTWLLPSLARPVGAPAPYKVFGSGERARVRLQERYAAIARTEQALQQAQLRRVRTLHRRVWWTGLAAIFAIPLLLLAFRLYVALRLLRPVLAVADLAERVERGEEGATGEVRGLREIAQLQDAFNRMSSSIGERRRELLDSAPIVIWEVVGREIRWISPFWRAMAGDGIPEPTSVDDIDAIMHPDDRPSIARLRREGLASGRPFDYRYRILRRDGQVRWLWTRARPMGTVDGQPRMIGFTLDVTEDERTRHELEHAQRLESVGQLASGVAHDFNNLLTVIAGYATLAQMRRDDPAKLEEPLDEIIAAAQRASALTRQLLMFSREQAFELQLLDLNEVVRSVIPMLERLIEERIVLLCSLAEDLPPIRFDRGQLEQVIVNLAVNARDAISANGRIVIATSVVGEGALRTVRLSVTDDGMGMDPSTIEHIFNPFFTTKPAGEGTGLGLSTVHGIVARGGGHIEVDSRPGAGSTFTVCFPVLPSLSSAGMVNAGGGDSRRERAA
jgi:PAS domain S-box-containing protein